MKGALIRSRARWVEQGEKGSKYFCNLENRHFVSKRMTSLFKSDGTEVTESSEIKEEVFEFYQNLYTSRENSIEDINLYNRLDRDTTRLTDEEAEGLEGLLSFSEAGVTLYKMQNNKSPGSTGYTTESFIFLERLRSFYR